MSTTAELSEIAGTIKKQVGVWAFAEVGARDFAYGTFYGRPGLQFIAKPRHRLVKVRITLTPADLYDVHVYTKDGQTTLKYFEGIYFDSLPTIIRSLPKEV